MKNIISHLICEDCSLVIMPKDGVADKELLSLFERHLRGVHLCEEDHEHDYEEKIVN